MVTLSRTRHGEGRGNIGTPGWIDIKIINFMDVSNYRYNQQILLKMLKGSVRVRK